MNSVVIVGAGPAGAAAAISLRQAGMDVTLLERERFPRARPGETLHPGMEPLLAQLGVEPLAHWPRHCGHWVEWHSPPRFEAFGGDEHGPWRGYQAWRAEFDALLLARAKALGAGVHEGVRVSRPRLEAGRVTGVETSAGFLPSDWLIDAGGAGHWLARHLDLEIRTGSPRMFVAYGYAAGEDAAEPLLQAERDGWHWSAPVGAGRVAHVRLNWEGVEPMLPEAAGEVLRADVTWRRVAPAAGPGYFCVGDAAAVLDPAASHGVAKAVMSGIMAAHVIAEGRGTAGYDAWLAAWFDEDVRRLGELYGWV